MNPYPESFERWNTRPASPLGEQPGDIVGHYRLIECLGEGGCGVVYRAEQLEPVRREVALKIIKLGMDSKAVIARFEAERQALALMDHPGIARVFDAGTTETGRPFFAMELVRGARVTEYCDQCALPVEARLRLFMAICHAVQHAHQKGIIHRDLKPSNVLVVPYDESAEPKIIDFGIAKALPHLDAPLTEATLITTYEQFIGTPAYMSPEQAGHSRLDLDTRTDVYSLGVLLHELLVGCTPFDPEDLKRSDPDGMRRMIREQEPLRPSARFLGLPSATRSAVAQRRASQPAAISGRLRGDLDWVVLRCLEKDRARRYAGASELAAELQRHLDHEPVAARRPGAAYRLGKYVRRNRTAVAALAAVFIALVAGLAVALVGARRAVASRGEAERQRALAIEAQRATEQQRAAAVNALAEAEAVTDFFTGAIAAADPLRSGRDVTIRQLLEQAAPVADARFHAHPLLRARLDTVIGETYFSLGNLQSAIASLTRAAELRTTLLPVDDPLTLRTKTSLAEALIFFNERHRAAKLMEAVLAAQARNPATSAQEIIRARTVHGVGLFMSSDFPRAAINGRELADLCQKFFGPDHLETLQARMNLGFLLWGVEDFEEAIASCHSVLNSPALPALHRFRAIASHAAGLNAEELGDYALAIELESAAVAGMRKLIGEEHFQTLTAAFSLEYCHAISAANPDPTRLEALRAAERPLLPPEHLSHRVLDMRTAWIWHRIGRHRDALDLARQAVAGLRGTYGSIPLTFRSEAELVEIEQDAGFLEEAEARACRLLAELDALPRRYEYSHSRAKRALAAVLAAQRRYAEAEQLLLANHRTLRALPIDVRQQLSLTSAALTALYDTTGRPERASEWRATLATATAVKPAP